MSTQKKPAVRITHASRDYREEVEGKKGQVVTQININVMLVDLLLTAHQSREKRGHPALSNAFSGKVEPIAGAVGGTRTLFICLCIS